MQRRRSRTGTSTVSCSRRSCSTSVMKSKPSSTVPLQSLSRPSQTSTPLLVFAHSQPLAGSLSASKKPAEQVNLHMPGDARRRRRSARCTGGSRCRSSRCRSAARASWGCRSGCRRVPVAAARPPVPPPMPPVAAVAVRPCRRCRCAGRASLTTRRAGGRASTIAGVAVGDAGRRTHRGGHGSPSPPTATPRGRRPLFHQANRPPQNHCIAPSLYPERR